MKKVFLGFLMAFSFCSNAQNNPKEVLFTIDSKPYYTDEFARVYKKNLDLVKDESQKDLNQYLYPNSKFQMSNSKSQIPNIKFQISNSKYQIPNIKYQISNIKFQIPNSKFQKTNYYNPKFIIHNS